MRIEVNYEQITSEIDPKWNTLNAMSELGVLDSSTIEDIAKRKTRSERAKTLLEVVLKSRNPKCCSAFLEALKLDNGWLLELISQSNVTEGRLHLHRSDLVGKDLKTKLNAFFG